jgi:tetratricopeptide (TPR) repeat protein
LNEYNRALELLIANKKKEALNVLMELLNTDLLDKVDKPQIRDGRSRPMLSLKYSCFKNVATIYFELKNYQEALYNYWEAANLDDSDVVLWYRIGTMATKISNLDLACFAYKQGLKRNSNHWPCLDNIITILYAIPDFMNCLLYISMALERDPTYIKGLVFRQQIFKDIPVFQECYKMYNSSWMQDPLLDTKYDQVEGNLYLNEAKELKKKWINLSKTEIKNNPLIDLPLRRLLSKYSWLDLGKSLVDMHRYIIENNLNFINPITLNISKWSDPTFSYSTSKHYCTELYHKNKIPGQTICCFTTKKKLDSYNSILKNNFPTSIKNNSNLIEVFNNQNKSMSCKNETLVNTENSIIPMDTFNEKEIDISTTIDPESRSKNFTYSTKLNNKYLNEKQNKRINQNNLEEINHNFNSKQFENDKISAQDKKEKSQKVKKRRRSSLCFLTQWAWSNSNIKRSSRVRSSGRKDYERDGVLLEEALKQIFPSTLL